MHGTANLTEPVISASRLLMIPSRLDKFYSNQDSISSSSSPSSLECLEWPKYYKYR